MIERLDVPALHATPGYSHVTVSRAGRLAHLAGQCPLDRTGTVVGAPGDVVAQTRQVVDNCLVALAAAGATPAQVVRSVIYVRSGDTGVLGEVWRELRTSPLASALTTACTLLGVAALGFPGQLVEIELTAALPGTP
jgi:enamine deaminase RidA (YjgF/YER057c/UK114 family)